MKVKIIQANKTYWYSHMVGQVLNVRPATEDDFEECRDIDYTKEFFWLDSPAGEYCFLSLYDCEIIEADIIKSDPAIEPEDIIRQLFELSLGSDVSDEAMTFSSQYISQGVNVMIAASRFYDGFMEGVKHGNEI